MLTKVTFEAALNADLDDHLGFAKHEKSDANNYRNRYTRKTLQTEDGKFELDTPRVSSDHQCMKRMDHANPALEAGTESFYD